MLYLSFFLPGTFHFFVSFIKFLVNLIICQMAAPIEPSKKEIPKSRRSDSSESDMDNIEEEVDRDR